MNKIIEWFRKRKIAKRDKNLGKELNRDLEIEYLNLFRVTAMTFAGVMGIGVAFHTPLVQQYILLQTGCGIGIAGLGLRYAVFVDMFAVQRVHEGSKGKIINAIERAFRRMPFRYLGLVKVIAHEARKVDLAYMDKLKAQKELEPENAETINKDIDSFNRISFFTDSSFNLKVGAFGALGIGIGFTRSVTELAVDLGVKPVLATAGRLVGYPSAAIFSLAQLGVYSTKRIAAGNNDYIPHPLHQFFIEKTHKFAMATPIRYVSWALLKYSNRKIQKLKISPALRSYLDETGRSQQLEFLNEASRSPGRMKEITMDWLQTNKETTNPQKTLDALKTSIAVQKNRADPIASETLDRTNNRIIRKSEPPDLIS